MKLYQVIDGTIINIRVSSEASLADKDWIEVPEQSNGSVGDKWPDMFDVKTGRKLPKQELIAKGLEEDENEIYYNMDDPNDKKPRFQLGKLEGWTKEKPLDEPYQKFDKQKTKWIVDIEKKEKAEKDKVIADKEQELAQVQGEIDDAERRCIRSIRAEKKGRTTEKDTENFDKWDSLIENELRPKYNKVDAELKKLKSA